MTAAIAKDAACPVCKKKLDHATALPGASKPAPAAGDFGMCIGCGAILRYFEDQGLDRVDDRVASPIRVRFATAEERDQLPERIKLQLLTAQRELLKRSSPGTLKMIGIGADLNLPHRLVPCDRCGRQMTAPAIDPRALGFKPRTPSVFVCTLCMPHAGELRMEIGAVIFPSDWATARRGDAR